MGKGGDKDAFGGMPDVEASLCHFRVANRIITVGDYSRAYRISKSFDGGKAAFEFESQRKFLTLTGTYKGVPITVVAIGMGFSVSVATMSMDVVNAKKVLIIFVSLSLSLSLL